MIKKILIAVCTLGWLMLFITPSPAAVLSQYKILDTETVIDSVNTTAVVDTTVHEIKLPQDSGGRRISFSGDDYDYVVLTNEKVIHYSYTGTEMVENTIANVNNLSNPLSVFSSGAYPDVVVATATDITHYSFNGTGMPANSALSVPGLTSVASVSSRPNNDIAFLQNNQLKHYMYNGTDMSPLPALSIDTGLNNPVEAALFQDTYDVAILEPDKVRFFFFTGTLTEAPDLAIDGFTNPLKSISVTDGTVSVVEGNQIKTYLYNGTDYSYTAALSVTSGLTAPTCVALHPSSRDMIITDGNEVKYYMFNGSQLVYNPELSKQVLGLSSSGVYKSDAYVQSNAVSRNTTATRITAYCNVPSGTSITWSIFAGSWMPTWRVRGLASSTVLEYSPDSGVTWTNIGTASTPVPGSNVAQLWKEHVLVSSVKWKAELHTDNPAVTPKIISPNPGVTTAVVLETNRKPTVGVTVPACYLTMTPTITWSFTDGDSDPQKAYDFRIKNGATDLYTYTVNSGIASHTMLPSEDPATPSKLWDSGLNTFTLYIRVSDGTQWSDWVTKIISFRAFERPRIAELSVPADGYISPVLGTLSTHKVIKNGMTAANLPVTKAGGQVTLYIDSIGMVDLAPPTTGSLSFQYLGLEATIGEVSLDITKGGTGQNRRWKIRFWTDPDKTKCPDNTVVQMQLAGSSGGYSPEFNCPGFAAGVVKTKGSVLDNWIVVLQGSQQ